MNPSYLLQDALLELPLDPLALLVSSRLAVERHEGAEVELGRLQQLHLADVDLLMPLLAREQTRRDVPGTEWCHTFWRG